MKRNPISSPCIAVCEFVDDVCTGCYRTQDEAYEWYELTDDQRDIAWDRFVTQCKENEKQENTNE